MMNHSFFRNKKRIPEDQRYVEEKCDCGMVRRRYRSGHYWYITEAGMVKKLPHLCNRPPFRSSMLSSAELTVVLFVSMGMTIEKMAVLLGKSKKGVRNTIAVAEKKLEAVNMPHMVSQAYQKGLLSIGPWDAL